MSEAKTDCLFCRIAGGEIPSKKAFEDDEVLAFHDINPQAPTHILVIPRRHIASLDDLADADDALVGRVARTAARLAHELGLDRNGYRVVLNCGAAAGQTVYHIHAHLLGGRVFGWPPG